MSTTVEGLAALQDKLTEQTQKVAKRVLRRAAKDASDIWMTAIIDNAPRLTGYLAMHIGMVSELVSDGIKVAVGPDKSAYYAKFLEYGTVHMGARPFMRPAFESTKDLVLEAFVADLRDELEALKE